MSLATNNRSEAARPGSKGARISFEDFLNLHMDECVEWVDGKVVGMAPVSDEHADVARFIQVLAMHWVEHHEIGVVRWEPVVMKIAGVARSPDALYVAQENLARVKKMYIDGPADLAVEVISPGDRGRDRIEKFHEYEQGGVREYWLIDPERKQAEFYQRGDDGIYRLAAANDGGIYESAVLAGLWLKVEWLWQRPMPTVLSVLREWKLV